MPIAVEFPETLEFSTEPYLTVLQGRTPEKKVHRTRGHAHNALLQGTTTGWDIKYASDTKFRKVSWAMALYEFRAGVWHLIWSGQPGDRIPVEAKDAPWKKA
jgi:hypothetical protein